MHVVVDTRPVSELSDSDVVAHLLRSIRSQEMRSAQQVKDECKRLFPDLGTERTRDCMALLAQSIDDGVVRVRPRKRR